MTTYDGAAVSFGGGLNSVAMTIWLVEQGWRGPIVFADTGAEMPETYEYLPYFEREWLAPRGLAITTLRGMPYQREGRGAALIDYCERLAMIPLYGKRWCTYKWKIMPLDRWCSERGIATQLVGIAADESHRRPGAVRPLCDEWVTRADCRAIVERAGLCEPPRSHCYICPGANEAEWRGLWREHPDLFERAARLEEAASARHGKLAILEPSGKVSLRQMARAFGLGQSLGLEMPEAYCVCHT